MPLTKDQSTRTNSVHPPPPYFQNCADSPAGGAAGHLPRWPAVCGGSDQHRLAEPRGRAAGGGVAGHRRGEAAAVPAAGGPLPLLLLDLHAGQLRLSAHLAALLGSAFLRRLTGCW